jgi:ABC-type multidrug transport system fused ATPase/permease subunit
VIISNLRGDWAQSRARAGRRRLRRRHRAFFTSTVQFPLTQTLTMLEIVIVLVAGSFMVLAGDTTFGVVVAFMSYTALLATPLSDIANLTATTLNAAAGGRRVFAIIDEQPTVKDAPDAASEFAFQGGHVVFQDVDFSYAPGRKILKHNTFEALPGQKIGICGPTGAGKSTIINILTRYYDIDQGAILHRRSEYQPVDPGQSAPADRRGAARGVPLLRHGDEQPEVCAGGRHRRGGASPRPSKPTPTSSS